MNSVRALAVIRQGGSRPWTPSPHHAVRVRNDAPFAAYGHVMRRASEGPRYPPLGGAFRWVDFRP